MLSVLTFCVQGDDTAVHGGHELEVCKNTPAFSWPLGNGAQENRSRCTRGRRNKGATASAAHLDGKRAFKSRRWVMRMDLFTRRSCREWNHVFFSLRKLERRR